MEEVLLAANYRDEMALALWWNRTDRLLYVMMIDIDPGPRIQESDNYDSRLLACV